MNSVCSKPSRFRRIHRGFTLIEIMVTVGIMVIIAAGVSAVFTSIADTVNTGKRVAEINRFSAQLERVMREDFQNLTRDGYLVITNQYTADSTGNLIDAQLSPADRSDLNGNGQPGHPRRIDEIMFFGRDQYQTARRAIAPSMIARSTEAAIYYGHGQKRRFDSNQFLLDRFFTPEVFDANFDSGARLGANVSGNPNQYASDWSLLRQVTLLIKPQSAGQDLPQSVFGVSRTNELGDDRQWLEDSDRQVALQPAARSIFSSLSYSGYFVAAQPALYEVPKWYAEYANGPPAPLGQAPQALRTSGLVDIVTQDLSSIKTILQGLSADLRPYYYWKRSATDPEITPTEGYEDFIAHFWEDDPTDVNNLGPDRATSLNLDLPGSNHVKFMRQWMIDSLPSHWDLRATGAPVPLSRVRYEDTPTQLLYNDSDFPSTNDGERARIYAEANQEMLGSSVFLPRCTEFIVEWSYGHVDFTITDPTDPRYKKMLWFGLDRWIDANDDGRITPVGNGVAAGGDQLVATTYARRPTNPNFDRGADPELIVGHPAITGGFGSPPILEVATFGHPDLKGHDWPWPKFIRVTISLADPLDPLIERTFQMVFDIPDASTN